MRTFMICNLHQIVLGRNIYKYSHHNQLTGCDVIDVVFPTPMGMFHIKKTTGVNKSRMMW